MADDTTTTTTSEDKPKEGRAVLLGENSARGFAWPRIGDPDPPTGGLTDDEKKWLDEEKKRRDEERERIAESEDKAFKEQQAARDEQYQRSLKNKLGTSKSGTSPVGATDSGGEYGDWTLAELQEEAQNRGLAYSGTKADIAQRLTDDDASG